MSDKVTAERVTIITAAARIPLPAGSAERIANGVSGAALRFAAENLAIPMEVEPATYAAIAQQDAAK